MKPMFLVVRLAAVFCLLALAMPWSRAQGAPSEREFPQSKASVEAAVHQLQPSAAGWLPVLDGFVVSGERPLDRFQRGYYQCTIRVNAAPKGGSLVQVSAKITAWYTDPVASKSGYQVLPSNGRLESDFLDRLTDALAGRAPAPAVSQAADAISKPKNKDATAPTLSAPMPQSPQGQAPTHEFPSAPSFGVGALASAPRSESLPTKTAGADRQAESLAKEAKGLEEILANQSHPSNLAAVKVSKTPVLVNPSEGAKVLFLADAEDEFEILDANANWVHVRISGLSRGWIQRSRLEMPEAQASETSPEEAPPATPPTPAAKAPFQIEDEQIASFPGDWEPLRGKTVKIVSVRQMADSTADPGSQAKLTFAKSLFGKEYADLTQSLSTAAGIVLIFDSSDGGMMAATVPVLREWKAGTLSDEALWRRCYFDPPEMFRAGQ